VFRSYSSIMAPIPTSHLLLLCLGTWQVSLAFPFYRGEYHTTILTLRLKRRDLTGWASGTDTPAQQSWRKQAMIDLWSHLSLCDGANTHLTRSWGKTRWPTQSTQHPPATHGQSIAMLCDFILQAHPDPKCNSVCKQTGIHSVALLFPVLWLC
jgi:hypothetical protein